MTKKTLKTGPITPVLPTEADMRREMENTCEDFFRPDLAEPSNETNTSAAGIGTQVRHFYEGLNSEYEESK